MPHSPSCTPITDALAPTKAGSATARGARWAPRVPQTTASDWPSLHLLLRRRLSCQQRASLVALVHWPWPCLAQQTQLLAYLRVTTRYILASVVPCLTPFVRHVGSNRTSIHPRKVFPSFAEAFPPSLFIQQLLSRLQRHVPWVCLHSLRRAPHVVLRCLISCLPCWHVSFVTWLSFFFFR